MEELVTSYILLLFLGGIGALLIGRAVELRMLRRRKEWIRFLIMIPQGVANQLAAHTPHEIASTTELYKRLHEFSIPFKMEAVVHAIGEEIHFYFCAPAYGETQALRIIESLWPSAHIERAEEQPLWLPDTPATIEHIAVGSLTLAKQYSIPLKTSDKGNFEPFLGVLRTLSNLGAMGDAALIQWAARPADPRLLRDIGEHLNVLEQGSYHPSRFVHEEFVLTPGATKSLRDKAASPLFAVTTKVLATRRHGTAALALEEVLKTYSVQSTQGSQYNHFKYSILRDTKHAIHDLIAGKFDHAKEMIVTAEELATYIHLPGPTTALPSLKRR